MSFGLHDYENFLMERGIEAAYEDLGYDYSRESDYERLGACDEERKRFLELFKWARVPTSSDIKRLFNQTNTFYAERWAEARSDASPSEWLSEINRLILFGQGKRVGLRTTDIGFGRRADLDFLDVRRGYQLLRGIAPRLLEQAVASWFGCISAGGRARDGACFLAMALIAIHPFVDGNGRAGRLAFTWLLRRWKLPLFWLAEAEDGEYLRVGSGVESTDYLMGNFMLSLSGGYNRIKHGFREDHTSEEEEGAVRVFAMNLTAFNEGKMYKDSCWVDFLAHLEQCGHFVPHSPRFRCLRGLMAD
jgi:hypothetical protein